MATVVLHQLNHPKPEEHSRMRIPPATTEFELGSILNEGKTKVVHELVGDPNSVVLVSKDDITAGDGAKHDMIPNKGALANQTTCNVFRLLARCGIPVAFEVQRDSTSFVAPKCRMLLYEVVVRREVHGSYLKRRPYLNKGQLFPKLVVEFFLKTSGRRWKEHELICDDPYMIYDRSSSTIHLYDPKAPDLSQQPAKPFLILHEKEVFTLIDERTGMLQMQEMAKRTFLILEKAWQLQGRTLVDFKVEFGIDPEGNLLLADVIDNDSWRVLENGNYIDKQIYRDGGNLSDVAERYRRVAEMTNNFVLPQQRVIVWRGSEKDDISSLEAYLRPFEIDICPVTCSVHKEPETSIRKLHELVQQVPDSVVIALIGRSNGAGPTLSAATNIPVISIPASFKEFPEDVWSSLRTPSNVPTMAVVDQKNAVLAAAGILSARNPRIYAELRMDIEKRLVNTVRI